ncbi:MAG: DUF1360 domain-containing protein [Terracidiphilus sp.]|jgi:hypothetical protein
MHHPIFPSQIEDIVAAVLILWRLTHLLAVEAGPFGIFTGLRRLAGKGFFGQLLDCFYCLSVWLAVPLALLAGEGWAQQLMLWPALSGAACLLEQATRRTVFPGIYEDPKE